KVQAGAEVFALLDQADIFVLPSRQEGLPRVVIEAMARGLPCFASALPGNYELLESRFLVGLDDVQDWTQKLRDAIDRPALLARRGLASCRWRRPTSPACPMSDGWRCATTT